MVQSIEVDENVPSGISHHFPVEYTINSHLQCRTLAKESPRRNFMHFQLDDMKEDLSACLAEMNNKLTFKGKVTVFQEKLQQCYDSNSNSNSNLFVLTCSS